MRPNVMRCTHAWNQTGPSTERVEPWRFGYPSDRHSSFLHSIDSSSEVPYLACVIALGCMLIAVPRSGCVAFPACAVCRSFVRMRYEAYIFSPALQKLVPLQRLEHGVLMLSCCALPTCSHRHRDRLLSSAVPALILQAIIQLHTGWFSICMFAAGS